MPSGGRQTKTPFQIRRTFDDLAPKYEQTVDAELRQFWGWSYTSFIDQLLPLVTQAGPGWLLDIATGTARIPQRLVEIFPADQHIVGLDLTLAPLAIAKRAIDAAGIDSSIGLVCASGTDLPFAPGVFDTVICALASHHIDRSHLLVQVYAALRKGGRFILADVAASPWWSLPPVKLLLKGAAFLYFLATENLGRAWIEAEAVSHVYPPEDWVAALKRAGFNQVEVVTPTIQRRWVPSALILIAKKP